MHLGRERAFTRSIGVDPGTVNFGICRIRVLEGGTHNLPLWEFENWELWDLKGGSAIRASEGGGRNFLRLPLPGRTTLSLPDGIDGWLATLSHFIADAAWLYERQDGALAAISVENQFDHIESQGARMDMLMVSQVFARCVQTVDILNAQQQRKVTGANLFCFPVRELNKHSRKYGVSNERTEKSNDRKARHAERKAKVIEVTYGLLHDSGKVEWIAFLDAVKSSGQKLDDLCDAFLLALASALRLTEEEAKVERKRVRELKKATQPSPTVPRKRKTADPNTAPRKRAKKTVLQSCLEPAWPEDDTDDEKMAPIPSTISVSLLDSSDDELRQ